MFVGREKELVLLNQGFQSQKNSIFIVYGREEIGKTSLVKQFLSGKEYVYYQAREFSKEEQIRYFDKKKQELLLKAAAGRVCFVVDEFDLMQKGYKTFFEEFETFYQSLPKGRVFVLLVSSAIQWVENSMVEDMGTLAAEIQSFIKVKEFTFMEMVDRFPDCTTQDCIVIYSILGGVPAYLNLWNPKETVRRNIIRIILDEKGPLHREAQRYLKTSLRELPYYSTILTVLAEDEPKLNYLYNRTHFSRAKISVYLKNLIQMDVATKLFSYEPEKKNSVQKGLYCITDSFLKFWYKLVYPNLSELSMMEPEQFYNAYIKKQLKYLEENAYIKVCREFMELMNRYHKLPVSFHGFSSLYGKNGYIPIVAKAENGGFLVGICRWTERPMGMTDFEELLHELDETGMEADYYYLFSKSGFADELAAMAQNMDNIQCIDLKQM
jgi:hypothetical protein